MLGLFKSASTSNAGKGRDPSLAEDENAEDEARDSWNTYPVDLGSVAGLFVLGFLSLILAMAIIKNPVSAKPLDPSEAQLPAPENKRTQQVLTLDELLKIMKDKLQAQGVAAEALPQQNLLRVMIQGPMFPLSKAEMPHRLRPSADAVSGVLAWALRCHLKAAEESPWVVDTVPRPQCSDAGLKMSRSLAQADCLANRGSIELAGLVFEGHTDSVPFRAAAKGPFKNNAQLSQARALNFSQQVMGCAHKTAQNLPPQTGFEPRLPVGVRGYGSQRPKEPDNRDPRNRRVEILFQETETSFEIKALPARALPDTHSKREPAAADPKHRRVLR